MKYNPLFLCSLLLSSSLLVGCGGTSENTDAIDETQTIDSSDVDDLQLTSTSALVINEIVAQATDGGDDWIELYAQEDIETLAVYSVTDDNEDRVAQSLPDVALAAGEFIIISAIDEEDTPPDDNYYVTFKLGSDDAVLLYKDDELVHMLDLEEDVAPEGTSYGLFEDGSGTAQLLTPTAGQANELLSDEDNVVEVLDVIINEDPAIRINEIVAKDSVDGYDWIEFFVTGSSTVNLGDYTISDESNDRVALPNVTLSSGDYYRVYATTSDDTDLETVAFKLGSNDEVNLYQDDDLIDQLSWNTGQALIEFSYGRFPDGSDATKILTPTPLTSNELGKHGPLVISEVVAADIDGGADWFELYNNSTSSISLTNYSVIDESDDIEPVSLPDVILSAGEHIVVYATDEETSEYAVSFKLGKEDELSLILNEETVDYIDWDESDVIEGFSYGLTDVTVLENNWNKGFLTPSKGSSNIIASAFEPSVVNNLYITITDENWQDILDNPLDEEYHETSISFNGVTLDSVAIRTKGGSSLNSVANSSSDRYSFKVDINEYVDGQKFFGLKKFTLQNSFNDPTYMREVIAYDLLSEMGVATPEHAYVNFYVNDELFGFYLMVEAIDGEFLEKHFSNSNGDMYKPDGTGSDLLYIDDDISNYTDINLQTNEETTDNGAFINFVDAMNNESTDVIDVDAMLRYLSVSVALSNLDSYHGTLAHNYYIYDQDGVFTFLPWDFNESFGTFAMDCNGVDLRELYIDEPTSGALSDRPMVASVLAQESNIATYHSYLWQLINGSLESTAFSERVAGIETLISEHVENDPSAFYSFEVFEYNLTTAIGNFYGLTSFMETRVENMIKQLNGELPSSGTGDGFCAR